MAKFQDEVELLMSARDEQIDAMRKAEKNALETERRQARREKDAIDRANKQTKQRERIQKEGYDKAEKNASEGGKRVAIAFESPLLQAALRATAAFGALELGLGTANALSSAFSGEIQDAAEAVKQLPAGIGPFARQLETFLGAFTGITQEIDRINSISANMAEASARRTASILNDLRNIDAVAKRVRDIQQDTTLREIGDPVARARQQEAFRSKNAVSDLQSEIRELQRKRTELSAKPVLNEEDQKRLDKLYEKRDKAIQKQQEIESSVFFRQDSGFDQNRLQWQAQIAEDAEQEINSFRGVQQERIREISNVDKEIERRRRLIRETQQNNAARSAELERDLAKQQAEDRDKMREEETQREAEAQKERVRLYQEAVKARMKFEEDLAKVRRREAIEANREQQKQVKQQQGDLRAEIARLRSLASSSDPQNTADQRRFLTGVAERSASNDRSLKDPAREQLEVLKVQAASLEWIAGRLENVEAELRNSPRVVGGGIFGGNN